MDMPRRTVEDDQQQVGEKGFISARTETGTAVFARREQVFDSCAELTDDKKRVET